MMKRLAGAMTLNYYQFITTQIYNLQLVVTSMYSQCISIDLRIIIFICVQYCKVSMFVRTNVVMTTFATYGMSTDALMFAYFIDPYKCVFGIYVYNEIC